jgi:5-methylthioadenosine/S-adenosylhomocysteine deaminase
MIHRIRYENPELLADTQMMDMAASKGAKALMMDKEIGSLERGKKADIVMLKNQSTVPLFEDNVENYIVGTCERCHVDTVMIDGKIVLEKGDFVEVDEDKILNSCRREASGLWGGMDGHYHSRFIPQNGLNGRVWILFLHNTDI